MKSRKKQKKSGVKKHSRRKQPRNSCQKPKHVRKIRKTRKKYTRKHYKTRKNYTRKHYKKRVGGRYPDPYPSSITDAKKIYKNTNKTPKKQLPREKYNRFAYLEPKKKANANHIEVVNPRPIKPLSKRLETSPYYPQKPINPLNGKAPRRSEREPWKPNYISENRKDSTEAKKKGYIPKYQEPNPIQKTSPVDYSRSTYGRFDKYNEAYEKMSKSKPGVSARSSSSPKGKKISPYEAFPMSTKPKSVKKSVDWVPNYDKSYDKHVSSLSKAKSSHSKSPLNSAHSNSKSPLNKTKSIYSPKNVKVVKTQQRPPWNSSVLV